MLGIKGSPRKATARAAVLCVAMYDWSTTPPRLKDVDDDNNDDDDDEGNDEDDDDNDDDDDNNDDDDDDYDGDGDDDDYDDGSRRRQPLLNLLTLSCLRPPAKPR